MRGTIQSVVAEIAQGSGVPIDLVIPDTIAGGITIAGKGVPWQAAFQVALASHGLWYRYEANGHLLRIAPRKQLDVEDEARALRH